MVAVFQPAEEQDAGAQAMIDDGLFTRFPRPDVVLGPHVAPMPAGILGLRPGPTFTASDSLRITMHGEGAHGSRPEASIDPIVMAAATVMRLQTMVSREIGGTETAVVTVGSMNAGTAANIIPAEAEIVLNVRTFTDDVRTRVIEAISRIVRAEAAASGATREPDIESLGTFPAVVNDPASVERTRPALEAAAGIVVDPGVITGSEDVGMPGTAAGVPCVYWLLGGADHAHFQGASMIDELVERVRTIPSNHSPLYAPVIEPTLSAGISTLVAAAREWLRTDAR